MKMVNTRIYMLYLTLSSYGHTTSHFDFPPLKLSNLNNLAFCSTKANVLYISILTFCILNYYDFVC